MKADKVTVPENILALAHNAGRELAGHYYSKGWILSTATNNRAMELAFLHGLLGYKFDLETVVEETLR